LAFREAQRGFVREGTHERVNFGVLLLDVCTLRSYVGLAEDVFFGWD
jgi:hypothetical protein